MAETVNRVGTEPAHLRPLADDLAALASASLSLALFTVATARPGIWPAALLAPLPILAITPELPDRRSGAIAFIVYLIGAVSAWPSEVSDAPVMLVAAAHLASAAWFAATVTLTAEAVRRWAGWLAMLVYPTLITIFWFGIAEFSPYGTWGNPAYGVATYGPLIQLSAYAGLASVNFVIAFIPSALAVAYYRRRWGLKWERIAIAPLALFVFLSLAGGMRLWFGGRATPVKIGVGATDQGVEFSHAANASDAAGAIELLQPIVHQLAGAGAQLVVLPSKMVGVTPTDETQIGAAFGDLARTEHVWLVVGWNLIGRAPMLNVAEVYSPDGKLVASYALRQTIPGVDAGYHRGGASVAFDAPWGRTAVMVGRDLDSPELGRAAAADGAILVLAPAWDLPGTSMMHARMAAVRGIESGFAIARATRQGESALYNSRGRTVASVSTLSSDPAGAVAELPPGTGPTFYARHGEWFAWLTVFAAVIMIVRFAIGALIDRRRRRGDVEWEHADSEPAGTTATRAATIPPTPERPNEMLHYRR